MAMNVNQTRRLINKTKRLLKEQSEFSTVEAFFKDIETEGEMLTRYDIKKDDKFIAITSPEVDHLIKFVTGVIPSCAMFNSSKDGLVFSDKMPPDAMPKLDYIPVYRLSTSSNENYCITARTLLSKLHRYDVPLLYNVDKDNTVWFLNSTLWNEGNIQDLADDLAQNNIKLKQDINAYQWLTLVLLGG